MKFLALVSGGKDSYYAIQRAMEQGHELVACLHMARPDNVSEESYMYQSAASECVRIQVEECLQAPYIQFTREGTSRQTSLVYEQKAEPADPEKSPQRDEVEDLFLAIQTACQQYPEIEAVCSGAILSTYQRVRVENVVCRRLQLVSLVFLWRAGSQQDLLRRMLASGLDAVLVRTAAPPGLFPRKHLNKRLSMLEHHFHSLYEKYQFHVCGEGGEYETLCVDSPMFHKTLVLDKVEIHLDEEGDDMVGDLRILQCHAEEKVNYKVPDEYKVASQSTTASKLSAPVTTQSTSAQAENVLIRPQSPPTRFLPRLKRVQGGMLHVSEIINPIFGQEGSKEAYLAVQEALSCFQILSSVLKQHCCTPQDVVMVHLYLSQMSHFASINKHYQEYFGSLLPPSRSCVAAVPMDSAPSTASPRYRVMLDCLIQRQSGNAMRNPHDRKQRRQVLHVQSRSFWAPVCVGPYSQANTLWKSLHYLAGQIGLDPPTMTLAHDNEHSTNWRPQLQQTWTNIAQVLDALDQGALLNNLLSCLVYVQQNVLVEEGEELVISDIAAKCQKLIASNAGIAPGAVDQGNQGAARDDYDGFEDEETMREVLASSKKYTFDEAEDALDTDRTSIPPILVASILEMPVGAEIEVEVVASSKKADAALGRSVHPQVQSTIGFTMPTFQSRWDWDGGFEEDTATSISDHAEGGPKFVVSSQLCTLGRGCAGYSVVTVDQVDGEDKASSLHADAFYMVDNMKEILARSLGGSDLEMDQILHLRVYYRMDLWQSADHLKAACYSVFGSDGPAFSFVPVFSMHVLTVNSDPTSNPSTTILGMQASLVDPANLDTELWIRADRQ